MRPAHPALHQVVAVIRGEAGSTRADVGPRAQANAQRRLRQTMRIESFLANTPADTGMAFVLVQHQGCTSHQCPHPVGGGQRYFVNGVGSSLPGRQSS